MTDQLIDQVQVGTVLEEGISFQEFLQKYEGLSAEWYAGKVILTVSNNATHQRILRFLTYLIGLFVEINDIGEMLPAGLKMYLSNNQPARQPDIIVVLNQNRDRIHENFFEGPVDVQLRLSYPVVSEWIEVRNLLNMKKLVFPNTGCLTQSEKKQRFMP